MTSISGTIEGMLTVRSLHASYGPVHVLQGISLSVEAQSTVALLGRNGVGKTTLVHAIMGVVRANAGSILLRGREIIGLPSHRIANLGIGLVPQGRRIFGSLTVRENLALGFRNPHADGRHIWDFDRVFEHFPILRERQDQFGNTLSGGEQQMLACARALLSNPSVLVMDEPSEGLAPQKLHELGDLIQSLSRTGIAILLVEQNMRFALRHCDMVYVMHRGGIGFHGSPDDLRANSGAQIRLLAVAPDSPS